MENKDNLSEKISCMFCKRLISNMRGHPKNTKYKLCSNCYELLRKNNVNEISLKFEKRFEEFIKKLKELTKIFVYGDGARFCIDEDNIDAYFEDLDKLIGKIQHQ